MLANNIVFTIFLIITVPVCGLTKSCENKVNEVIQQKSYIELVMVVDYNIHRRLEANFTEVHRHCIDIVKIVNNIYEPLNIAIALVDVVVWSEENLVDVYKDSISVFYDFLAYRRDFLTTNHPNDYAILLMANQILDLVGKSIEHSICSYRYSGAIVVDLVDVKATAMTIAHEIAHSIGVKHDTPECECKGNYCIMTDGLDEKVPHLFSSCSIEQINFAFSNGMNHCLRNKPTNIFDTGLVQLCGNGFVDDGEECDCGPTSYCRSLCCDPSTCRLHLNASCAIGECCDLTTCHLLNAGTVCRPADGECDIPESCTGNSEYCPENYFKGNDELCNDGKNHCYGGSCPSHTAQCKLLWGPSGHSFDGCYIKNLEGTGHGDCGYNIISGTFSNCFEEHIRCGRLQCTHWSKYLKYGWDQTAKLNKSEVKYKKSLVTCYTVSLDMGLQSTDPGLTPDGSVCGKDKICISGKCLSRNYLRDRGIITDCKENCSGHGTCDNKGRCHCGTGFNQPFCNKDGDGHGTIIFLVIFIGILPLLLLVIVFAIYKMNFSNMASTFW